MEHCARNGEHKILERCTLPLTAVGVVKRIITDLGIFDVTARGLVARELAPGVDAAQIRARTGCPVAFDA
jgi:3-oxoacid CoA-transferase subunit B